MLRHTLSLLCVLTWIVSSAWGQTEREHFQIKIGASFDRGDYGTPDTTRVLFVPITFRYLGEKYDLSVTPSFARVDTTGGVRLIEGVPTPTGERNTLRALQSGAGDTVIRSRYFLVGGTQTRPSITPFVKIKIPTAPENLNLGTGKTDVGFGVELDHQVANTLLFGDLGYTMIGKVPGLNLRNRVGGSFGLGERLSDKTILSGLVDWRRSIVIGTPDPAELMGVLTYRVNRSVTVSPNMYVGLTSSSPDFGGGLEIAFRFGRH